MKKIISTILSLALISFVLVSANFCYEKEIIKKRKLEKAIETIEINDLPLTDYELSKLYTCKTYKGTDSCIEITIQDANLLMKIARSEGGPTLDGQLWAMRVIYNRLSNGDFGNSIWEIVSSSGQFDVFTDGSYINADVNENTHVALAMIEGGWDETQGALYWRTKKDSEGSWHERNLEYIATVDGNKYYR